MRGVFLDSDTLQPEQLEPKRLEQSGPEWTFYGYTGSAQVDERIADADVVITNKVVLDRQTIEAASRLQLICVAATGTNNVDLEAAGERGIPVCNVTGYATPSVAQHTLALILGLATRWHQYSRDVASGVWSAGSTFCRLDYPVVELAGKRLGIVGYGTLGRAVAELGRGLGMEVLVAQSLVPDAPRSSQRWDLDEMLEHSDVVTLHCPQTPETQKLMNAQTLARLKPGAFLVNTARGGLVEPGALLEALDQGRLGGAALDVLEQEPPPASHPLLNADHPNLIITPHNAWVSGDCRQRLLDGIADNIRSWRAGSVQNCVNGLATG
jgi:glycerate dehydrogenase